MADFRAMPTLYALTHKVMIHIAIIEAANQPLFFRGKA